MSSGYDPEPKPVGNGNARRVEAQSRRLAVLKDANKLRRPCPHCGVPISPEGMKRHVALCGEP